MLSTLAIIASAVLVIGGLVVLFSILCFAVGIRGAAPGFEEKLP